MAARGQGSDKDGLQMIIEFIGRHHGAGTSLANFPTAGGTKRHEIYLAALRTR